MDVGIDYELLNFDLLGIILTGEIGLNNITEKIENYRDNKYQKFGYGFGISTIVYRGSLTGLVLEFPHIYKIEKNLLIGFSFRIPIYSFDSN